MEDRFTALRDLAALQARAGSGFVHAEAIRLQNDYPAASVAYQDYLGTSRAYLAAAATFNLRFPASPFDLRPIAQPLVNALMVGADIEAALGNRDAAEALRAEALSVSRTHLGRTGSADTQRARAASLTLEGRFNEAIVALMEARDVLIETGDAVALARIALDLADVLHWLGDYTRAADEVAHAHALSNRCWARVRQPSRTCCAG